MHTNGSQRPEPPAPHPESRWQMRETLRNLCIEIDAGLNVCDVLAEDEDALARDRHVLVAQLARQRRLWQIARHLLDLWGQVDPARPFPDTGIPFKAEL
jgi:hypothetical protein